MHFPQIALIKCTADFRRKNVFMSSAAISGVLNPRKSAGGSEVLSGF
jgi:hypothetical protein